MTNLIKTITILTVVLSILVMVKTIIEVKAIHSELYWCRVLLEVEQQASQWTYQSFIKNNLND